MSATLGSCRARSLCSDSGPSRFQAPPRAWPTRHDRRASSSDQTTFGYDGAGRLTSLVHNVASTANDVTFTLARNAGGRIRSATTSTTVYDWTPPGASTVNDTYDGLNRDAGIAAVAGGYDARGNLTNDGTRTLTYDVENRLLSASGSPGMSLVYDPIGRLHQTTAGTAVTQFLYDGDELSAEYDGAGTLLRRYVHGPAVDEPLVWYEGAGTTDKRWLHADMQGSVIFTTNSSGARTYGPYKYGPYGEPAAWSGSRFSYTGQIMLPEARLYHYKARAYDPSSGRFMQTDPVGYDAGDLDLYRYVDGDPINRIDPTGNTDVAEVVVTAASQVLAPAWVTVQGSYAGQPFSFTFAVPSLGFHAPVYNQSSDDGSSASSSRDRSGTAATPPDPDDDNNSQHAKDQMGLRNVSQERVDEAKRIGREKPGNSPNEVVREVPSSQSTSGRGVRIVIDRATGRVVTIIDKGSGFK